MGLMVAAIALSACKKDMFDADTAKTLINLSFHNDTVDYRHNWTLTSDWYVQVKANVTGVTRLELLSGNPYTDNKAEVVANSEASEDSLITLYATLPQIADSIYVAAVDANGNYHVVAVGAEQHVADFSKLNTRNSGTLQSVGEQEMYYCYCASYPEPSETWGFNDCVLRISKHRRDSRTVRINVSVEAVGTTKQYAAALRLNGINYEQVEKVEPVGGNNFRSVENLPRTIIRDDAILLRGNDGSAVINMFDDAHAAYYNRTNSQGIVFRYRYNVRHGNSGDCYEFTRPAVSYDITFKDVGQANTLTYTALDPFILVNYAGTIWEVHKYPYKFKETLYYYYSGEPLAYNNGFTWALEIPYSWFRYPLTDYTMGSYKRGALYGAYQTFDHSFGEWGANRLVARDWYLYPNTAMVY